ncbi:MAG: class I adenylate-forming enzyme family protein [Pseudomonadota bacterium]|nr:class I adenylate-forming enzyme family protein [Pseudomonadota bacterium]
MLNPTVDPERLEIPFRTLGAAFADYESLHPEKTAIFAIDQGSSLSFGKLRELTDRLAARMWSDGVRRGDRVAILASECMEKLVLMFAAWRCGASSCPFHAEIAPDHLRSILHTISPALIVWRRGDLDGEALVEGMACPAYEFSSLNAEDGYFANLPDNVSTLPTIGTEYGPGDEGCIFATSGTTDRPKCVVWDQLGLWLCGLSTIDFTGMHSNDRILEYRTFSWLSPQIVTFMPFVSLGLTIVMAEGFSRSRFIAWVKDYRVTIAAGVPTVINMLLDEPVPFERQDIATLRIMTASSAPLAPERWRQFEAYYGIRLLQFYGASEGGWLCGNRQDKFRVGTAGPPARHMDLAIIAPDGTKCPSGVEGEITIRGPQTATASITADGAWEDRTPFRLTERTRVGDLGVLDADGFITVTGRVKDIILRGGASIAPLEIDAALMTHPDVHEAAVVGVPDRIWGEEIAAYVVRTDGADSSTEDILAHAAAVLPEFKRPKTVEFIDALPKNERGKIRRDELKKTKDDA